MGVSGTVGLIKKHGAHFCDTIELRNMSLVIDITDAMLWFLKGHLLGPEQGRRFDLAGWSQVQLGEFLSNFFKRLKDRNVKPIIVYNGGRVSERAYGRVASKSNFLTNSCRAALIRLSRNDLSVQVPEICLNTIKEVINERGFEQVHQACYESHLLLAELANRNHCPVISSHSDMLFSPISRGFIWFEDLPLVRQWPSGPEGEIRTRIYNHQKMLDYFKVPSSCSSGLSSLYVLLRDDFARVHYSAINQILLLNGSSVPLSAQINDRQKTKRLIHLMQHWPRSLTNPEVVYEQLMRLQTPSAHLKRDYEGIWLSYKSNEPLGQMSEHFISEHFLPTHRIDALNDALTRRECSANFLLNLKQAENFNRLVVEDFTRTYRSTFSVSDRVRQYILAQLNLGPNSKLFDRRGIRMELRELAPMTLTNEQMGKLDKEHFFLLFHFDDARLEELAKELCTHLSINLDGAKRLALLLLIVRFAFRIAFRDSYDNSPRQRIDAATTTTTTTNENSERRSFSKNSSARWHSDAGVYLQPETREKFYVALVNSFIYHMNNKEQGDIQRQEIPAEHRVMQKRLQELGSASENFTQLTGIDTNRELIQCKHQIEVFNAALSAYKELNSLYNFPGPNVLAHKYYDGVLIYKILTKWSNNLRSNLLTINQTISEIMQI